MRTAHGEVAVERAVEDGLGRTVRLADRPRRIVSLVPSLTEALAAMGLATRLLGRTDYCVQPANEVAPIPTIGGTKTPDLDAIRSLKPDLIVASAEENVRGHIEALIADGYTIYISLPNTVARAIEELGDLARLTGREAEAGPWLRDAETTLASLTKPAASDQRRVPYFCPIWRRPYMVAGPETYMTDLLRVCGGTNVFGGGPARYYDVELDEAARRQPELVILPDEPYPFAAKHIQEIASQQGMPAAQSGRIHLIDGQLITWYGPRIGQSLRAVAGLFGAL